MAKAKPKVKKVKSIAELVMLAQDNPLYAKLLIISANNLGGNVGEDQDKAKAWLHMNAAETDEEGVVGEINFCIPLLD